MTMPGREHSAGVKMALLEFLIPTVCKILHFHSGMRKS